MTRNGDRGFQRRHPGWPALLAATLLMAGCSEPDLQDLREFVAAAKVSPKKPDLEPLPEIRPYEPFSYSAQDGKDPFAPAPFIMPEPEVVDNGVRPDADRKREELEKYALGSLKMVGTLHQDQLWALVQAPGGRVQRIRVGNYMGTDYGQVTRITHDRIELREIVPGQESSWIERENSLALDQ